MNVTAPLSECRQVALRFASEGWLVFPCNHELDLPGEKRCKKPLIANGFHGASLDPCQIETWWRQWPDAMIGVPAGRATGVFILDPDVDPEKGLDGLADLAQLVAAHGALPDTVEAITPRGGRHLYFKWIEGITNSQGSLPPSINVRGEGGYFIAPPSRRADGAQYKWWYPRGLFETAPAPDWLIEVIRAKPQPRLSEVLTDHRKGAGNGSYGSYAEAALSNECAAVAAQSEPGRNNRLNQAAFSLGQLVGAGMLDENIVIFSLLAAAERCGLVEDDGERQVRATIASGLAAGRLEPRQRPEPGASAPSGGGAGADHEHADYGAPPWPDQLDDAAFHGLAGDVVHTFKDHTEADPAAILLQFLTCFGNAVGRHSYVQVEGDRHPPQIWPVLIGETAKARKGTSFGRIRGLFDMAAPGWTRTRIMSGLSSGEGVIWQVRDPIVSMVKDKKTGDYHEEETDAGVDDKRLLVVEAEFASPLRHMERAGNTLSSTLRCFWDTGSVSSLTKNSPARTTGAMVSVIGHVTVDELRRYMTRTEMGNGFANRLLFVCVRRSKVLPFGGGDVDLAPLAGAINVLTSKLYADRRIGWAPDAAAVWEKVYAKLSEGRPGLTGAVTSRAEAQVLRIALIYALLDEADRIQAAHLNAALAVWKYCEQSAVAIFGSSIGDPLADDILRMLKAAADGMTRTQIRDTLGRHQSSDAIGRALGDLLKQELAYYEERPTKGRSEERWFAR